MSPKTRETFAGWRDRILWVFLLGWAAFVTSGAATSYLNRSTLDQIKADVQDIKKVVIGGRQDR